MKKTMVDMREVCPQDVRKLWIQRTKEVQWKKWAAKHECEELKEGVWIDPVPVMQDRKWSATRTSKHRNGMRKLGIEGGWVQKKLENIGWSDEKMSRGCEKCTEKHRFYRCPGWRD